MSEELDNLFQELFKENKKKKEETPEQEEKKPEPQEIRKEKPSTNLKSLFVSKEKKEEPKPEPKPEPPKEEPKTIVKQEGNTIKVITLKNEEFDFSEETELGKEVHMIYGHKGHGKTTIAMSYPGKVAVLSFDRKSTAIKYLYPDRQHEIKVWNAIKYMDYSSPESELASAEKTFRYLIQLIDKVIRQWEPDWVVIDGSEILSQICELVMRYRNGLMPFQGIANFNLWKERKMYLRQIHNLALDIARKGIIYTAYCDKDEVIEDGEVRTRRDIPKWLDILIYETDVVIKALAEVEKGSGTRFYAIVESSKVPYIKSGIQVDITGRTAFDEIIRLSKQTNVPIKRIRSI